MRNVPVLVVVLCLVAFAAAASEDCSKLGGRCRAACGANEAAEAGAFEDCAEREECCVPRSPAADAVRCCILSFDRGYFGPENCGLPVENRCARGSASPAPCDKLAMCRN